MTAAWARLSTIMLSLIPRCPGIHKNFTFLPEFESDVSSEMMSVIRKEAFFFFLKFSMAFRQDSESEHIILDKIYRYNF